MSADYKSVWLPIIRNAIPNMIAADFMDVQPMVLIPDAERLEIILSTTNEGERARMSRKPLYAVGYEYGLEYYSSKVGMVTVVRKLSGSHVDNVEGAWTEYERDVLIYGIICGLRERERRESTGFTFEKERTIEEHLVAKGLSVSESPAHYR